MTQPEPSYLERPALLRPLLDHWTTTADEQVASMQSLVAETYGWTPRSVLDVGCGVGRHVVAFAERDVEAHGVDVVREFVERAEERAAAAGVADATSFFHRDVRDLGGLSRTYDLLVNVWSFGYFADETNEAVVEAFHDRLEPDGVLLLKLANKEGMLDAFDDDDVISFGEYTYVRQHQYEPRRSRVRTTTFVVEDGTYLGEYEYDKRVYAPVEVVRLLTDCGFTDVELFGSLSGEKLTRAAGEMVVLARK